MTVSSISLAGVALLHQDIALAIFALGHERPEPFHRLVALRCAARLLDESEHLAETPGVDGNHQEIQQEGRDGAAERAEDGEEDATDHVRDPQRHHGLGQQGGDEEDRADQGKHVGERDVVQEDFQQAVEDGVPGDVVGVEPHLDQDLCDPEVVGRRIEDAVQRVGHVCAEDTFAFAKSAGGGFQVRQRPDSGRRLGAGVKSNKGLRPAGMEQPMRRPTLYAAPMSRPGRTSRFPTAICAAFSGRPALPSRAGFRMKSNDLVSPADDFAAVRA